VFVALAAGMNASADAKFACVSTVSVVGIVTGFGLM
jgi:hypothetical protein